MTSARIVGAYHRPPALLILQNLPTGQLLSLEPEPDNPYDANAIKVILASSDLPQDTDFSDQLTSYGHELESLQSSGPIHLGYIERGRTQDLKNTTLVLLSFDGKGRPLATRA
jgi:hypothetical protein